MGQKHRLMGSRRNKNTPDISQDVCAQHLPGWSWNQLPWFFFAAHTRQNYWKQREVMGSSYAVVYASTLARQDQSRNKQGMQTSIPRV